jgi:hypothetical protein
MTMMRKRSEGRYEEWHFVETLLMRTEHMAGNQDWFGHEDDIYVL